MGGLNSGGAEHQMVLLASLLKRAGYNVTFLTVGNENFFLHYLNDAMIPIIRIRPSHIKALKHLQLITIPYLIGQELKLGHYDTVISFLGIYNFANCIFANYSKTEHRAITGIRNNRHEVWHSWKNKFFTLFEINAYQKVSNSDSARIKFANDHPALSKKLTTIYNIVDLPPINTSYQCRKNGKINIIVPASYRPVKNPMGLLNAVALMSTESQAKIHIDWYGNIKGCNTCYNEMIAFIIKFHLDDVVTLHDATKDIANRIYESDVIGMFSTSEGLPNAICEGMSLGKPVIMSKVSDYEALIDCKNGFLCDASDPQNIANALTLVSQLTDEELITMGRFSKEKADILFSKDVVLKKWESII